MDALPMKNRTILDQIIQLWRLRQRKWEEAGSVGKKPKLYETVEDIVAFGLGHRSIVKELSEQNTAGAATAQGK